MRKRTKHFTTMILVKTFFKIRTKSIKMFCTENEKMKNIYNYGIGCHVA